MVWGLVYERLGLENTCSPKPEKEYGTVYVVIREPKSVDLLVCKHGFLVS